MSTRENRGLGLIGFLSGNGDVGGKHMTDVLRRIEEKGEEVIATIPPEYLALCNDVAALKSLVEDMGFDLDFDEDTEVLYLVNKEGERVGLGTGITAGISGLSMYTETDETNTQYLVLADADGNELCRTEFVVSGSGSSTAYVCRLINGMSSGKLSYPSGQNCLLSYSFVEYYGQEQTTVNAALEVYTKTATTEYTLRRADTIAQGNNSVDVTSYLQNGTNYVKLQITGGESGTVKVLVFTINVVDISLTSSFDQTQAYNSSISFMYRVTGRNISKVMHFKIDNNPEWTVNIGTAHNVQLTETINLASYGHGDHVLKCWFVTGDGAISPTLTYDIMFDTGASGPIISSTFDVDEVDYGDLIRVQYCVFTHGSDYTSEVSLDIYTKDEQNNITYFSQQTLANVVNESLQSWNITEYPESGKIYLKITAGSASKTFEVMVNENTGNRDLSGVTTRLIAAYTPSGRSNSDVNKAQMNATYTSVDDITTVIPGTLTGFNWRSNGWLNDGNGYPTLRVSGGAEVNLNLPFFAASWTDANSHTINLAGTPTGAGRTFEVSFATSGVTDEDEAVITVWDETGGIGIKIFPSKAWLLSGTMSVQRDANGSVVNKNTIPYVPFDSSDKVRISFVIEEIGHYVEIDEDNESKQLIKVYVNGELAKTLSYTNDDFTTSLAKPKITASACIAEIYSMRMYDYALNDSDILKNYIADLPSIAERIEVYDKNAIIDDDGKISIDLARTQYPCMVLTGQLSQYKGNKVKIGVLLYKPDSNAAEEYDTVWEFMETDGNGNYGNVNNVQGTSSQYYLKKNYKITFYRWNATAGKFAKEKVSIFSDRIPVSTVCVKADYMSPDSANTGNANFWQTLLTEPTPPQEADQRCQTSVMGYPILMFQRDSENDTPVFIGRYNLNNDKGNSEAFGLENSGDDGRDTKCQKWEYKDNSEAICNFLTDHLRTLRTNAETGSYYEAWEDALESCYPDQGDLEDEGLRPNTDYMQIMYSWVCQRANFINASTTSGTGGTYNGTAYDTEYDMKLAIFRREFQRHFNLHHTLHYFIAVEIPLLVDNLAKNMFMTCYDVTQEEIVDSNGTVLNINDYIVNGAVDISLIDWENSTFCIWYPTLYDLDSCLGADNNGYDKFPYYKEAWDTYNGDYVVNGHSSLFWQMVYTAFYDELKALYKTFRDTDQSLSPALYRKAMIDDLTASLPIVAVNKDEQFKYIDAFEGGYYDGSLNGGEGGWNYTTTYLYLVKGTMASYHADFINKRFAMLDSKYMSDAYRNDNFNFRVNRGQCNPDDVAFSVSPCQTLYCYSEWANSGSYVGGKCLEGDSIELKPSSSGEWYNIVVAIYGASKMKSLGDLSVCYPSHLQNLSACKNLTELILGSDDQGYENQKLESVSDVSYLKMLQKLNIQNCSALTGTVDLSNCDLIEEVYAEGSGISAVVLPEGGYLKKLYLPGGITALNILDHSGLTHFGMDSYASLTRLRVENTPNIDTAAILAARGQNITRLRLIGVNWTLTSEAALRVLADDAMAGKAIDANGNNVTGNSYPTVTGTVSIDRIQESLYNKLQTRYPDLTITAAAKYHVVKFYSENTVVSTQEVTNGSAATTPSTPTKAATVQNVYSFSGWDASYSNITADTTINAQFSASIQQYDVNFYEDSTKATLLETVSNVSYGGTYTYPGTMPTKSGNVFCGWQDASGNEYIYPTQMPDQSAAIDSSGYPIDIDLWPIWSPVQMVTESKDFAALTPGEALFCAIAIQDGSATGCTVNYYSETATYIIRRTDDTTIAAHIALADTRQWTLANNETLTQQVLGFNHDYYDSAESHHLGITYAMKDLLTDTRQMNPGYRHAFNYQFGSETAIVSDNNDHNSATDAALTHSHTASADEVTAGFVEITALGPTYLTKIEVTHSDSTKTTWYLGKEGFYGGTDASSFTKNGANQSVSNNWYLSDLTVDASNPFYKMGKILQSLSCDIVNWKGSVGLYGWATEAQMMATLKNQNVTLSNFGGLKIDTTGTDTVNTATKNLFDGTGKARVTFFSDYTNSYNNYTEISEGTVISVPVVSGDVVTVVAFGEGRTWGGWDKSALNAWANGDFLDLLPLGLRNIMVPALKKTSMGNRSYAIQKNTYKVWCLSRSEVGGDTASHPYMDEGSKYSIFSDNASRIKYLADGDGVASYWWHRSPNALYANNFSNTTSNGGINRDYAYYRYGVCLGFCSGKTA